MIRIFWPRLDLFGMNQKSISVQIDLQLQSRMAESLTSLRDKARMASLSQGSIFFQMRRHLARKTIRTQLEIQEGYKKYLKLMKLNLK